MPTTTAYGSVRCSRVQAGRSDQDVATADSQPGASVRRQSSAVIPTPYGAFEVVAFAKTPDDPMPNLALIAKGTDLTSDVLLRAHSECLTGDLFGSHRCDCGEQLERALAVTSREGGVVLYLRQEGRGIGLINKLKAYRLQDDGADTVEANALLHLPIDGRDYSTAIAMAESLGVQRIRLLTNNPLKVAAFEASSIAVIEQVPIEIEKRPENERYLNTKRDSMGHTIT